MDLAFLVKQDIERSETDHLLSCGTSTMTSDTAGSLFTSSQDIQNSKGAQAARNLSTEDASISFSTKSTNKPLFPGNTTKTKKRKKVIVIFFPKQILYLLSLAAQSSFSKGLYDSLYIHYMYMFAREILTMQVFFLISKAAKNWFPKFYYLKLVFNELFISDIREKVNCLLNQASHYI